jgi:hypothetical protein
MVCGEGLRVPRSARNDANQAGRRSSGEGSSTCSVFHWDSANISVLQIEQHAAFDLDVVLTPLRRARTHHRGGAVADRNKPASQTMSAPHTPASTTLFTVPSHLCLTEKHDPTIPIDPTT